LVLCEGGAEGVRARDKHVVAHALKHLEAGLGWGSGWGQG